MTFFQIVEIFRSPKSKKGFEFVLLLFKDKLILKKVHPSCNNKLTRGQVFKNDFISISADSHEGATFEVVDTQGSLYEGPLNLIDYIYGTEKHLPFLNDTLPYHNLQLPSQEVEKLNVSTFSYNNTLFYNTLGNLTTPLIGTVKYKTRINQTITSNFKYYLFMILEVGNELLKVVVWRENIKYSSLMVGDVVGLQKYRVNKGYSGLMCLDYNRFSEAAYFNIQEVTGTDILKFNVKLPCGANPILPSVKGFISYRSVLNRRFHSGLDEYYLLVVDDKPVVFFYNSDDGFYDIEAGNTIEITNLREVERAGFHFFVSTIYSQIQFEKVQELDELCSSFLYEGKRPMKRQREEDEHKKKRKINKEETKNESASESDVSSTEEKGDSTEVSFLENPLKKNEEESKKNKEVSKKNEEGSKKISDVVDEDIHEVFETPSHHLSPMSKKKTFVEVAVGYIPDCFTTLEEVFREQKEIVNNEEYSVPLFYRPVKTTVGDLKERSSLFLINEVTKWLITAELCEVDYSNYNDWEEQALNDGVCISFIQDGSIKEQLPVFIRIKDDTDMICYLFPNYFIGEIEVNHLYEIINKSKSYEEVLSNIGKTFHFVIQSFRASDTNIINIITGVIPDSE